MGNFWNEHSPLFQGNLKNTVEKPEFVPYPPSYPSYDTLSFNICNLPNPTQGVNQMTIMIGVLCKDGLVIGSDGLSTLTYSGGSTISQKAKKLEIIDNQMVYGLTGYIGLGQIFIEEIKNTINGKDLLRDRPMNIILNIRKALSISFEDIVNMTNKAIPSLGNAIGGNVKSNSIGGFLTSNGPTLFHFNEQLIPTIIKPETPFHSIGCNDQLTDSFMANINRLCWNGTLPTVKEGILSVIWGINKAIELNPMLGHPIQIIKLENNNNPEELSGEDISDYLDKIGELESSFQDKWKEISLS